MPPDHTDDKSTLFQVISQHWFRQWLGAEQAPSHYLNRWWPRAMMAYGITRQQWVNPQGSRLACTRTLTTEDTRIHRPCQWASCQIRKIAGAHAPGMPGMFSPSPQVSDPNMHHGTCVTHVPWCMPGSLTSGFLWNRRRGETFPAFPAHAQPAILRIW